MQLSTHQRSNCTAVQHSQRQVSMLPDARMPRRRLAMRAIALHAVSWCCHIRQVTAAVPGLALTLPQAGLQV